MVLLTSRPLFTSYHKNRVRYVSCIFRLLTQGSCLPADQPNHLGGFQSPAKPALPRPDANSSLFNSAANTATPFRNPSFTTPRKPFDPDLFSETSGAESSPADNADAEDTPERAKKSNEIAMFTGGLTKRKPLFGRYGASFAGNAPGRGEVRRGKYPDAVIRKVRKRKRTEKDYTLVSGRRGSSDYESDFEESRPHGTKEDSSKASTQSFIVSFLSFIESKPQLPSVLSYYVQFLFNAFLTCIVMYLVYNFWCTVKADIDKASATLVDELVAEMTLCARNYAENKCSPPAQRLPALGPQCDNWEMCMNQDPTKSGRSKIGAYTLAEIINNFVEPISWKAMVRLVRYVRL
jgi:Di-sulfide bridge nucleocytoplasmic transport domain